MKQIAIYDSEGYLLEVISTNSIRLIEEMFNISQGGVNACLSGKALSTNNLQFREVVNKNKPITKIGDIHKIHPGQRNEPIQKFYRGNYIKTYENMTEASSINGIGISSIYKCCEGLQKKAGIYTWKYVKLQN